MRVLLAVPRCHNPKQTYREYPLGVGFVGTILKRHGHDVRIVDGNVQPMDEASFVDAVAKYQPDAIGFSVITPNYPAARRQIEAVKRIWPRLPVVVGGIHATLFPEDLLADGADVVVLGEGEGIALRLFERLRDNQPLRDIGGLVFRDKLGAVVVTARPDKSMLDDRIMVDRSLYDLSKYSHHSILASRGCPYRCAFCCNPSGADRTHKAPSRQHEAVIAEMEYLRDSFGAREIFFADDVFLHRRRDLLAFCQDYSARRVGVRWIAQLRPDRMDREAAQAFAGAGCQRVCFGVEAGSDAILRRARKGASRSRMAVGVRAAIEAGLRVKTGWIYGLPGSLDEQYESIRFMRELRPHEISIHQLIPFPGTVYYAQPQRFGIRIANPKAFEGFCYGGLDGNIQFDYLSQAQLMKLLEDTAAALEAEGYVSSDLAGPDDPYVYSTPLCRSSMTVFRPPAASVVPA
jgi:radical SAM superfamily enzyme YgiQ (UPF0313 family)